MAEPDADLKYPFHVFFIVVTEFCERFSFYGMRTILSLYIRNQLHFSESNAKKIYHSFIMMAYFFPLLGATIADSWLGKFYTITFLSLVYAGGNTLLAIAAIQPLQLPDVPITFLSLLLIALGTGGIKPCVSAFGGDQFVLPDQRTHLGNFFSLFYFSINAGAMISTFVTPIMSHGIQCFDEDSCYSLAFAAPAVLMIMAVMVFVVGRPFYKIVKPAGNVIVEVVKCVSYGIWQSLPCHKDRSPSTGHWMDRAEPKFDKALIDDVKIVLKVLLIFTPLPFFWALYDQQGSGWIFLASRMNGDIGYTTVFPEHIQLINPLLILLFLPAFTYGIYPLFNKFGLLKSPLQKMVVGGFIAVLTYVIGAGIAFAVEAQEAEMPTQDECFLRFYNPSLCEIKFDKNEHFDAFTLLPMQEYKQTISLEGKTLTGNVSYSYTACEETRSADSIEITPGGLFYHYFTDEGMRSGKADLVKSKDGYPKIRTLSNVKMSLTYEYGSYEMKVTNESMMDLPYPGFYHLMGFKQEALHFKVGGIYAVLVQVKDGVVQKVSVIECVGPNTIHMAALIPQIVMITFSEILISVTGLEFSYSEAPISMKSFVTAAYLLTVAFGNLAIVAIEAICTFERESVSSLTYAGLMLIDILIFVVLTLRYTYEDPNSRAASQR